MKFKPVKSFQNRSNHFKIYFHAILKNKVLNFRFTLVVKWLMCADIHTDIKQLFGIYILKYDSCLCSRMYNRKYLDENLKYYNMGKKKLNRVVALTANFTAEEHQQILKEREILGFTNTEYIRNKVLNPGFLHINHVALMNELSSIGRGMHHINLTIREAMHLISIDNISFRPLQESINEYITVQKSVESLLTAVLRKVANKR